MLEEQIEKGYGALTHPKVDGPWPTRTRISQAVIDEGKSDKGTWPNAHRPPSIAPTFRSSALLRGTPHVLFLTVIKIRNVGPRSI